MRTLPGGEDWLLAPVHAQMCKYESLIDGTLSLADIALMNDSLAVRADAQRERRAARYGRHHVGPG
ncbi:DUF6889 family protein [Burkholderia multivorans]|uniref:DUF6889 family protein n=1 Tax=Burkholderia multivorans TaxID=87883 RepID=UPI003BA9C3CE